MEPGQAKAGKARSPETLREFIMDPRYSKTEQEHWACRHIEALERQVEELKTELAISRQCEVSDEDERREQALIDEAAKYRTALVEIYDAFDDLAKSGLDHPAVDMAREIIARASKT